MYPKFTKKTLCIIFLIAISIFISPIQAFPTGTTGEGCTGSRPYIDYGCECFGDEGCTDTAFVVYAYENCAEAQYYEICKMEHSDNCGATWLCTTIWDSQRIIGLALSAPVCGTTCGLCPVFWINCPLCVICLISVIDDVYWCDVIIDCTKDQSSYLSTGGNCVCVEVA